MTSVDLDDLRRGVDSDDLTMGLDELSGPQAGSTRQFEHPIPGEVLSKSLFHNRNFRLAGRRRPYVNPFRLLLVAIVVYALISSFGLNVFWKFGPVTMSIAPAVAPQRLSIESTIEQVDRYGWLRQLVAAKREQLATEAARERFHHRLAAFAQPVSFTNVVLLAATLHLIFRRKRRRFLEHAAFSMHAVSFVLLSSVTLLVALRVRFWLGGYLFLTFGMLFLWQFAYLTVAIRRFYLPEGQWGSWLLSVAAAFFLYVLNSAFMTAVQVAGAAIALALI